MEQFHQRSVVYADRAGNSEIFWRLEAVTAKMVFSGPASKHKAALGTKRRLQRGKTRPAGFTQVWLEQEFENIFERLFKKIGILELPDGGAAAFFIVI